MVFHRAQMHFSSKDQFVLEILSEPKIRVMDPMMKTYMYIMQYISHLCTLDLVLYGFWEIYSLSNLLNRFESHSVEFDS